MPERPSTAPENSDCVDIWKLAYQRLSEKNPKLIKNYEHILTLEEGDNHESDAIPQEITHSISRLTSLAAKKLAALDDSRLKIRLKSKTFVVKDGVDQVLKVVIRAKDFVSGIVTTEPHGAVIWAGVCVLLPVS